MELISRNIEMESIARDLENRFGAQLANTSKQPQVLRISGAGQAEALPSGENLAAGTADQAGVTNQVLQNLRRSDAAAATAQPSGESLATGTPEQAGGALLNTSDAGLRTGDNTGLRQIIRAEIKPLDSADAQTPAAQGASAGASETQASPMAPEQQTGSIVNTTDHRTGFTIGEFKGGLDLGNPLMKTSDAGAGSTAAATATAFQAIHASNTARMQSDFNHASEAANTQTDTVNQPSIFQRQGIDINSPQSVLKLFR